MFEFTAKRFHYQSAGTDTDLVITGVSTGVKNMTTEECSLTQSLTSRRWLWLSPDGDEDCMYTEACCS